MSNLERTTDRTGIVLCVLGIPAVLSQLFSWTPYLPLFLLGLGAALGGVALILEARWNAETRDD